LFSLVVIIAAGNFLTYRARQSW